jgi:hypothetical protein
MKAPTLPRHILTQWRHQLNHVAQYWRHYGNRATIAPSQMILNHKTAIELLVANIDSAGFDRFTQALDTVLARLNAIADPIEQAFFAMVHLPYLQPFADINKRTSRLMANLPLFKANLCPLTFLDVPQAAYSMAMLGVYELGRVELLRDLFVWAYERSTQEYVARRQTLAEPDPLRLAWRTLIRDTLQAVVTQPQLDALALIIEAVTAQVPAQQQHQVQTLIVEELRRLHEGVLSRYGLRPAQYHAWKNHRPSPR